MNVSFGCRGELSGYAIGPRGTRTRGTFGLRWCPSCRPPRAGTLFVPKRAAFVSSPPTAVGVPFHEVKAELHPSPQSGQECPDVADEVMLRIRKREAFLPILPGTGKTSDSPSPEHSGDRDGPARRLSPRSASGIPPRRRRPRPASSRTGAAS